MTTAQTTTNSNNQNQQTQSNTPVVSKNPGIKEQKPSQEKQVENNLQTLSQIKSKTSSLIKISLVVTVIFSLTTFVLLILIVNKSKQLTLIQTQISAKSSDLVAIADAVDYLNNFKKEQDIVLEALPDEINLINFVNTIELLSSTYSTKHSLEFSALAPTKAGNNQYIPLTIEISTNPSNFTLFLAGMEKLPYIIEITGIQSTEISVVDKVWEYKISSRVYVQNPFKSSN